jgi:hypothetical protein
MFGSLTNHHAQSRVELLDAFEQIESESGTGKVDPEVALQMKRDASASQAAGGKAPVVATSANGLQDPLLHQGLDELGLDGKAAAQLGQGEGPLFVDQLDGGCRLVFLVHGIRIPPLLHAD